MTPRGGWVSSKGKPHWIWCWLIWWGHEEVYSWDSRSAEVKKSCARCGTQLEGFLLW